MEGNELLLYDRIAMKLGAYQSRRGGRKPAKIFLSPRMLLEINREPMWNYQASTSGEGKLFGIPVSVFCNDGSPEVYLSDEEE